MVLKAPVLLVGLDPDVVDYSKCPVPGLDPSGVKDVNQSPVFTSFIARARHEEVDACFVRPASELLRSASSADARSERVNLPD
jgi:hypothetical protein